MCCERCFVRRFLRCVVCHQIVYENVLYCLVVYLGPLSLLVFFNARLASELVRSHRERRRSAVAVAPTEDGRERNNLTLVMVVIVVIFLVTQTPAYVNQLLYYLLEHSYSGKKSFDSIRFDSRHRIEFFDSIRFGNLINLPDTDGEFGEEPGGVSLRCGSFCDN